MTGQVCASLTRIVVSRHRHDEFADALSAAMSAIRVGDPLDPETEMGPLAMSRQLDKVEGLIAKGCEEGATLVTGGRRPAHLERGFFIEPTVFGNVDNHSTIARGAPGLDAVGRTVSRVHRLTAPRPRPATPFGG